MCYFHLFLFVSEGGKGHEIRAFCDLIVIGGFFEHS